MTQGSRIHPTAILEDGAVIGAGCDIQAFAIIRRFAILGDGVVVHPGAVIGGDPQYLKFDPQVESFARIGKGTVLREHTTVNRAVHSGQTTLVGDNCFLMTGSHVAHDCVIGNQVVLANNVLLAGHVQVGDHVFVGGSAAVHQNVRIGEGVMLGGGARICRDLAPYTMVSERDHVSGLNLLGLKRRGVPPEVVAELKRAYRDVYLAASNPRLQAERALAGGSYQSAEVLTFLKFFHAGKRGFARAGRALEGGERGD